STAEDPIVSPDTTTTYYVYAETNYGCRSALDSATVYVISTPVAEAGPPEFICGDQCVTLNGSFSFTTTLPPANLNQVYYSWSPNVYMDDSTIANPTVCPPQSMWYYLETRYNDCITRDSVFITVGPEVVAVAEGDTTVICQHDSVQLTSFGSIGTDFSWAPVDGLSDPLSANPMASPDTTTTYTLIVAEGGCADTSSITIHVIPGPTADYLSSAPSGCVPHPVHFTQTATNALHYIWDFGDGSPVVNEAHPTHIYNTPGTYTVSLTAVNVGGCAHTVDHLVITVADTANAEFTSNPEFPVELALPATEVQFTDLSQNATNWYWDFGDGVTSTEQHPMHSYSSIGSYFVTLIVNNPDGCSSQQIHGPYVIHSPELFIPNVFSPNNDNINDIFLIEYTGDQPYQLRIFDRWGVMLYETRNKTKGWNGKNMDNDDVDDGVYYYHVRIGDREFTGPVTLMR
ncbi:MAG: PKD domain-containing protein, partial [Bacteroidota bacterium]